MQIHDQGDRVTYVLNRHEVTEALTAFIAEAQGEEALPTLYKTHYAFRNNRSGEILVEILNIPRRQRKP